MIVGDRIVQDGLVFCMDRSNRRSFKGKPTTNYVGVNADQMDGWTAWTTGSGITNTNADHFSRFRTELGSWGYKFTDQPSYHGIVRGITLPSIPATYTFSVWVRYLGGSTYEQNYGPGLNFGDFGTLDDGGTVTVFADKTKIGEWQRISATVYCTFASGNVYLYSYGGRSNRDFSSWEVTQLQVEAGSVATPFVSGSRGSTNMIYDLMGNTALTVPTAPGQIGQTFTISAGYDQASSTTHNYFGYPTYDAPDGFIGSVSPTTINGKTITEFWQDQRIGDPGQASSTFRFTLSGFSSNPGQSYFTSLTCNGETVSTSNAAYGYSAGYASWTWQKDYYQYGLYFNMSTWTGSTNSKTVTFTSGSGSNGVALNFNIIDNGWTTFSFDGVSNYIKSDSPTKLPVTNNGTVLVWCKPSSSILGSPDSPYTGLVSYGTRGCNATTSDARLLSIGNNGTNMWVTSAYWCNDYTPDGAVLLKPNAWNYVAMVSRAWTSIGGDIYAGNGEYGNTSLYSFNADGHYRSSGYSANYGRGINSPNTNLAIGCTDYPGRYFAGEIDVVQIYDRELSPEEINANYEALRKRYGL